LINSERTRRRERKRHQNKSVFETFIGFISFGEKKHFDLKVANKGEKAKCY